MPVLVRPAMAHMASFVSAMLEGYSRDTLRPETPEGIAQIADNPEWFLRQLNEPPTTIVLPDGTVGPRVAETRFWYVEGDIFIGDIAVRHRLSPMLEQWGGHIGYAVRPSGWGQGHASAMLAGMLDYVRDNLPLERVTLTANVKNGASIRVIEKNGGVLEGEIPSPWIEGEFGYRYWIALR